MTQHEEFTRFVTRIEIARREQQRLSQQVRAATGLTLSQCLVLSEVEHENRRATVSALAVALGRAVHTLTSAVNSLERKGLVVRSSLPAPGPRITRIVITAQGAVALRRFRASVSDLLAGIDPARLDEEQSEDVQRVIEAMVRLVWGPQ